MNSPFWNPSQFQFVVPKNPISMDLTISDEEKAQNAAFLRKIEKMKANGELVMECSKCLLIFSDVILYRMHMSMHGIIPSDAWKCTMCHRQYSDRREFFLHTVKFSHSLIPPGVVVPPTLSYNCGLPDLASLVPPAELLKGIAQILNKKQ